ncbi:hypothetical protein [Glycomyces paridis]|uniref:YbaB/EbfC family nucleoid-associated protein n=1 Tax=Glycomyces paridis TaxID=2126555 RepID=A0A4S8P976_9ACTN|nr:hypothetical protein [Glycomyces paridis]THV26790.1 hypothetical protein E9998_17550 [Glycomyces paridis]
MSATVMSEDQILAEAAGQIRAAAADPYFRGDPVQRALPEVAVTAVSDTHTIEATMTLDLVLKSIRLPHDLAQSVTFCADVSEAAGSVLTALHAACSQARATILAAAGGTETR